MQTVLKNNIVSLIPLKADDFEKLFAIASDPLIWEQHPNKNRYQREVFANFFNGAMLSKGAYIAYDTASGEAIGSSRFYDPDTEAKTIHIGYTFLARKYWGTGHNRAMKTLMLNYAFTIADTVHFHIGAENIRSQKAIEKLGAIKISEQELAYFGEPVRLNFIYAISSEQWKTLSQGDTPL